ncbi:hypothetical protein L798_04946 [Zootermopsis nevadensis]|uniref:Uncharacterized protein n=1 Tax=Zootermopsis nevadensis TaxID=136037 RepID=A0A067R9P7_ZOONE|nr:hypothetical protein L798_04946 [Zootermopsis nevadensis]
MSDNNSSNMDQISNLNPVNIRDENFLETLTKCVDDTLIEIKKCLDQVLDLRVHTAELEVSLMILYNPDLLNGLEEVKDIGTFTAHLLKEDSA